MPTPKIKKAAKSVTKKVAKVPVIEVELPEAAPVNEDFKINITLGEMIIEGKGADALEALRSLEEPVKIFTKGHIQISMGDKSMEQTWTPAKIRRLFQKISQPVLAKQFTYLLR